MKRTTWIILAAVLALMLAACGHTHEFGGWTTVTEATCTAEGLQERLCECGEKETQAIKATGHTFGDKVEIVAVTCTDDGKTEATCAVCGTVETETVSATGHAFQAATAFAPKTCKTCGLTEGEALATVIAVGDTLKSDDHSFVVEKTGFTGALKDKRGNITYNYGGGDFVFNIKLDLTNLATDAFERWNSDRVTDVSLEYAGKYTYEGEYWCPDDDIVPLDNDAIYIVYSVPKSMSEDTTSSIMVTFTIDDETYAMVVQEGESIAEEEEGSGAASDVTGDLTVGDVRSDGENFSFELKDVYFTKKPSEKRGNVTYNYGSEGCYLVCKLDFTNLATEALEEWNSDRICDMKLTFSGKYDYDGRYWCPGDDIVPLANGNVYVIFEVSEMLQDSTDSLIATFTIDGNEFTVDCRA